MESEAVEIVRRLRSAGHEAYFAGGCVRDRLRGIEAHDIDIATSAHPEEVIELFPRTVTVGAHFGVVVVLAGGHEFEVATFRADGAYVDGRHPVDVTFTSAEIDAHRRDFTINGLFFDPIENQVIDFVGGREDLERKVVRAIGEASARFREDQLRVLRGVRFASTLGFEIEQNTWQAICRGAVHLDAVSSERIRDEMVKILVHPNRVKGFDLLHGSGLLERILPEIAELAGCEQPPEFHPEGDVFTHTRIMLDMLQPDASMTLVFGVLFHDVGKPPTFFRDGDGRIRFNGHEHVGAEMARAILQRLRFSSRETDDITALVKNHMTFKDVKQMRVAKLKRLLARETFADELELHRVDCASSHGMLDNFDFLLAKEREFSSEPLIPPPLVTGHDLIALGLEPGPAFKPILEAVETAQLEGTLSSRSAALEWISDHLSDLEKGELAELEKRDRNCGPPQTDSHSAP